MPTIPFFGWIANAAAYLTGSRGAVAQQARQTGCSRQYAYDHAEKVLAAVEARRGGGLTRARPPGRSSEHDGRAATRGARR